VTPDPKKPTMPQIPEGELYLFVRLDPKTQEFQCLFSDLFTGLALHDLADTFLENLKRKMFTGPEIQAPTFDPRMLSHFTKGRTGN
jgi:hypothetical protein